MSIAIDVCQAMCVVPCWFDIHLVPWDRWIRLPGLGAIMSRTKQRAIMPCVRR